MSLLIATAIGYGTYLLSMLARRDAADFELMQKQMNSPVVIDGRNIYDREAIEALGFCYYGIGR